MAAPEVDAKGSVASLLADFVFTHILSREITFNGPHHCELFICAHFVQKLVHVLFIGFHQVFQMVGIHGLEGPDNLLDVHFVQLFHRGGGKLVWVRRGVSIVAPIVRCFIVSPLA